MESRQPQEGPWWGLTMALPNSASSIKVQFVSTLGSLGSCGLEEDDFSSGDEAVEADNEDEAEPREDDSVYRNLSTMAIS